MIIDYYRGNKIVIECDLCGTIHESILPRGQIKKALNMNTYEGLQLSPCTKCGGVEVLNMDFPFEFEEYDKSPQGMSSKVKNARNLLRKFLADEHPDHKGKIPPQIQ